MSVSKNSKTFPSSAQAALHAVKTIPYGANKKTTPPKPSIVWETHKLNPTEIFNLIKDQFETHPEARMELELVAGDISEKARKQTGIDEKFCFVLNPGPKVHAENLVSLQYSNDGKHYIFNARVLARFSNLREENDAVYVQNIDDSKWTRFFAYKYVQGKDAEKNVEKLKIKKRQREENEKIEAADRKKALEVMGQFSRLTSGGDDRPIHLQVVEGSLRGKLKTASRFWLLLDYTEDIRHAEDILTFKSTVAEHSGPTFKAFITPDETDASSRGNLVMEVERLPNGQDLNFWVDVLYDPRYEDFPSVAKQPEVESPNNNPVAVIDDGGVQPMDHGDDDEDFGLAKLVKETISNGVKKLKADLTQQQSSSVEAEKQRIRQLEQELQHDREMAALKIEMLNNEIAGLKLQISSAENKAKQAELRSALLSKTITEKVVPDKASVNANREELLAEVARLNQERSKLDAEYTNRCVELFQTRQLLDRIKDEKDRLIANSAKVSSREADLERQISDLKEILHQKLNDIDTFKHYQSKLGEEMAELRATNASLRQELNAVQATNSSSQQPSITHAEALAQYINEHRERLESEVRQQIRQEMKSQLDCAAYREILNSNPQIRRMVQNDMMQALESLNPP